ncbi:acidic fibroblast growth factor intracellular-binding protein isoform X1 [Hyla sarda]|uniref:acidic fibroblast growth factor intracellular-binding protein isoform X1 n=2 Tax=Hyla sarda TaxID=327740 RepID=UPI0024C3B305|nr:acidic fibroblast growth factor intracellular-binding protein isoform X1 [Hyla sarda]
MSGHKVQVARSCDRDVTTLLILQSGKDRRGDLTMASELDVFVGNTTLIDEEVYQLWLDGYSVNDAVNIRLKSGILDQTGAGPDVLESDTMDHYRTFQMIERLLHYPPKLVQQLLFQIPPYKQSMLIERYYAFDEAFVREVLGKKLSKGTKKDLDDISAKTGVTLKSCRRQFDNFKRVFKVVEEMRGALVENIQQNFLLSDRLARDYAAIVFFANSRFETGKRKLQYLTFEDFATCAEQLIQNWTLGAVDVSEDMDMDLDKEFLQDLKELKILITDKDLLDQHKSLVCTSLRGKIAVFHEMEANFKTLSRALVNIGTSLTHNKDLRDFFIDLVEKFIEPCKAANWSSSDVQLFLTQYTASARALDAFKQQSLWERYMVTLRSCLLKMYHS